VIVRTMAELVMVARLVLAAAMVAACEDQPTLQIPEIGKECIGIPAPKCDELIADALDSGRGVRVISVSIRCTAPVCTLVSGEAAVSLRRADGSVEGYGTGWAQADPAGRPPIGATRPPQPAASE
jgi:hypothetical protein